MKTAGLGTARSLLAPLRVGFWRAVGEALVGWFLLIVVASAIQPGISTALFFRPTVHSFSAFLALLGWVWAVLWPVWRLRRAVGAYVWTRLSKGVLRIGLLAAVVGLACVGVAGISEFWPGDVPPFKQGGASDILRFAFAMWFFRLWVDVAAGLARWARTKLRRQLAVSYMFVIMSTFLGGLGVASLAIGFGIAANLPSPASQARAIGEMLGSGSGAASVNPGQAQVLLQGIASERIRPVSYGGSPLNLFIPWRIVNRRIEVVDARRTITCRGHDRSGKR